ncbi:MAG TPA: AAA family ATPase [Actinomycetota bacterium]|nr:AAA family ATPase [Actinomycetota bacterium]
MHGVVVGKFYPPHAGHKYLIGQAEATVDRVTVVLLANSRESIPVGERHAWLQEIHPNVQVVSSVADHPIDYDDASVWDLWEKEIRALCPEPIDLVFSSESYGDELARRLDAEHVPVDPNRAVVPISGTAVRADPAAHWNDMEPCVRAWFVKRVCVLGAESTGTSTLAKALARHYEAECVPEYGRQYCEERRTWEPQWEWKTEHFLEIAVGQVRLEDDAARRSGPILICDTDPLATSVWHERYMNAPAPALVELATRRRYDLYVLTGSDIPWVQDGTRDGEEVREWMTGRLREVLSERSVPFIEVTGSLEQRLEVTIGSIDRVVAGPWTLSG